MPGIRSVSDDRVFRRGFDRIYAYTGDADVLFLHLAFHGFYGSADLLLPGVL